MPTRKTAAPAAKTVVEESPRKAAPRRRPKVTHQMIETRAYMISLGDHAGTPVDNWLAAERELLAQ
jgi:hypothetical protein